MDAFIGKTVYSNGSSAVVTTNSSTVITVASWTGGTPTAVKPYQVAAAGINGPMSVPVTIGTISSSGIVMMRQLVIVGNTALTAVSTTSRMAWGVTGSTALFLPTTAGDATGLTANKFWNSSGADTGGTLKTSTMADVAVGANMIITISGENILTGALTAIIYWDPISNGATLT